MNGTFYGDKKNKIDKYVLSEKRQNAWKVPCMEKRKEYEKYVLKVFLSLLAMKTLYGETTFS